MSATPSERRTPPPILTLPPEISEAVNRACEIDRNYFRRRPHRSAYTRNAIEGEFWPLSTSPTQLVRVKKISTSQRSRTLRDARGRAVLLVVDTDRTPNGGAK